MSEICSVSFYKTLVSRSQNYVVRWRYSWIYHHIGFICIYQQMAGIYDTMVATGRYYWRLSYSDPWNMIHWLSVVSMLNQLMSLSLMLIWLSQGLCIRPWSDLTQQCRPRWMNCSHSYCFLLPWWWTSILLCKATCKVSRYCFARQFWPFEHYGLITIYTYVLFL